MKTTQNLSLERGFNLHWQMTNCERFALCGLLKQLQPKLSLEIGTYKGGSLQALAEYSEAVISVDIDPSIEDRLKGIFTNVEFRAGDSARILPDLVRDINEQKKSLAFVLIDGDHSAAGVRRDIETLLELRPLQQLVFLLHDSFNPACREGMRTANWAKSPFVHDVELDFIPGIYHYDAYDTAERRSMWGGFACAVLMPETRSGPLIVNESQKKLYELILTASSHVLVDRWRLIRRCFVSHSP